MQCCNHGSHTSMNSLATRRCRKSPRQGSFPKNPTAAAFGIADSHRTAEAGQRIRAERIAAGGRIQNHAHAAPSGGEGKAQAAVALALDARLIEQPEPSPGTLPRCTGDRGRWLLEDECRAATLARPRHRTTGRRTMAILERLAVDIESEARHRRVQHVRREEEARNGRLALRSAFLREIHRANTL